MVSEEFVSVFGPRDERERGEEEEGDVLGDFGVLS